jgi:hypothetical protein
LLKDILARANSRDYRILRSKAVETISLIGVAVGKQKFAADAKEVMESLQRIYTNPLDEDDPLREYGLRVGGTHNNKTKRSIKHFLFFFSFTLCCWIGLCTHMSMLGSRLCPVHAHGHAFIDQICIY